MFIRTTCVCSWSLRSSNTVSKSNDGKPLLRLRSERKLTARVVRLAVKLQNVGFFKVILLTN